MTPPSARNAFTLVELIVAGVLISMIAGAGVVALSSAAKARDRGSSRAEAAHRAAAALARITADLENTVRDADLIDTRLLITSGGSGESSQDQLLIMANLARPVRGIPDQPEGREAEVHFRLSPAPADQSGLPAQGLTLWRRADPNPGPDDVPEGGGVAVALVDGVESLSIAASDGQSWFTSWDSDAEGLPHAVVVSVTAVDALGQSRATRRAVVAFDRVPVPAELESSSDSSDDDETSEPDAGMASGGSTTTGGGTTGGGSTTGGGGQGGQGGQGRGQGGTSARPSGGTP